MRGPVEQGAHPPATVGRGAHWALVGVELLHRTEQEMEPQTVRLPSGLPLFSKEGSSNGPS